MQVSIRIAIAIAIVIARDVGLLNVEQTRLGSLGAWLGRLLSQDCTSRTCTAGEHVKLPGVENT